MEELGFLYRTDIFQSVPDALRDFSAFLTSRDVGPASVSDGIQQPVSLAFEGHRAPRTGLEMHMVGCGGSAAGAVVEYAEVRVMVGEVHHIHQTAAYALGLVLSGGDDQM